MTLETFFEKFDQFADAPDAVAKMRELVLLLAVQGKLVDQLPNDEPATKLLERIQKSKERLIKERAIRRQETEPIDCDSAPFSIPQSWVWTRLGEIGDWGSGSTPPRGSHDLYDGGVTWLKSGELNDNLALAGSSETVTELALKTGSFRRNQPGDVLFAMYGATIGKVAILAEPAVTNQAVCGCTPFEGVSNRYLFNYLVSQRAAFHEASEGGAQPNLSKVKIVAFPFPLPPLAEQKRIVAKVDELMALCDRLEAQQQEREEQASQLARASLARFADAPTPANLEYLFHSSFIIPPSSLRKSILTLAVQGKLVPQAPNDEPACNLIARAQEERKQLLEAGIVKRVKPLEEKGGADEFLTLPVNWASCCLDDIALKITDGEHATPARQDQGHYLLSARNVRDGFIDVADVDYVGTEEFERIRKRCDPDAGDILLSCSGSVGRVAVVDADNKYAMVRSAALIKHSQANVDSHYLSLALRSPRLQSQIERSSKQSAQANLFIEPIRRLVVPLPPLAEQRRIVAKVEQLMALVDALETQLAASRATATNLLSALVAELTQPS